VLLLRIAYIVGGALFVADVLVAGYAAVAEFIATGTVSDTNPYEPLMEWLAVVAFVFVAIGAVLTIVTTLAFTGEGIDTETTLDA
jgi:hypothetical protein